jgi:hypothetical protein
MNFRDQISSCENPQVIEEIGGASRDRTDDLIVANDALSQLSYSPIALRMVDCPIILSAFRDQLKKE